MSKEEKYEEEESEELPSLLSGKQMANLMPVRRCPYRVEWKGKYHPVHRSSMNLSICCLRFNAFDLVKLLVNNELLLERSMEQHNTEEPVQSIIANDMLEYCDYLPYEKIYGILDDLFLYQIKPKDLENYKEVLSFRSFYALMQLTETSDTDRLVLLEDGQLLGQIGQNTKDMLYVLNWNSINRCMEVLLYEKEKDFLPEHPKDRLQALYTIQSPIREVPIEVVFQMSENYNLYSIGDLPEQDEKEARSADEFYSTTTNGSGSYVKEEMYYMQNLMWNKELNIFDFVKKVGNDFKIVLSYVRDVEKFQGDAGALHRMASDNFECWAHPRNSCHKNALYEQKRSI